MTYFPNIKSKIDAKNFLIPILQPPNSYFPEFLKSKFEEYIEYYKANLESEVDKKIPFEGGKTDTIISKIESISNGILESVTKYYEGNIFEATQIFNNTLDNNFFHELDVLTIVNAGDSFYRTRKNENKMFSKEDLFHIKFELRHIVSTNRFSVPGFPALYLGDTTYTCWEEFGQHKLRDLYFSRFQNTRDLKVIHIEKIEDFLEKLDGEKDINLTQTLSYFVLFPLTIACSIKTQFPLGNFKPEYIIPQLLLQYISKKPNIDGLKFPSTRIDYSRLSKVKGYNYVFPVKSITKSGFCEILKETFHCTEPTSLELEEIINNPIGTSHSMGPVHDGREIELIKGIRSKYSNSSFGKLEHRLLSRSIGRLS
ncbi:MAG: RES family NAD+ phosphorylase [Flavobacterium sp. JAD_PAG50586_2]|nr:MAG: RES family NAD+ phosphorylase [Flavobacterium sp. JAD_PAG50586_2]